MTKTIVKGPAIDPTLQRFADTLSVISALAPEEPVYCLRPDVISKAAKRFISLFPGQVMYAVKCNPQERVIDVLYDAGVRDFDVASLPEIELISTRYRNARAHFMHPVKSRGAIRDAYGKFGVRAFSIDHPTELEKVLQETGGEGICLFVRIKTPSLDSALYDLSQKFGADVQLAAHLLAEARARGCRVGLAFHVGSQCLEPRAYSLGLDLVAEVVERAGAVPEVVDVGGGFPVDYPGLAVPPLEDYVEEIKRALAALPFGKDVEVYAEPGRALVAAGCSLLVQVYLRKDDSLYINDGIHGGLIELLDSKYELRARVLRRHSPVTGKRRDFKIFGPTCDSVDALPVTLALSEDVREGDWIEIDQMGAYSSALTSRFNGFSSESYVALK